MFGVLDKIRRAANAAGYFEAGGSAYEQKHYLKALDNWRRASALGHTEALYRIGLLYARGEGVLHNLADAVVWYRQAAEAGWSTRNSSWGLSICTATMRILAPAVRTIG